MTKKQKKEPTQESNPSVLCTYSHDRILTEGSDLARVLYNQSRFGNLLENGRVHLSMLEALYLVERGKIIVVDGRNKALSFEQVMRRGRQQEKNIWVRYCVFRDLRMRGYIVKTALKFGADFRVYNRGVKPGEDHARWIVYPVHETSHTTWYEFSAKNRVAHSTKKHLLVAVVDDESDVTYWEIRWLKP